MKTRPSAPLFLALAVGLAACNGLAGIADFHEVDSFDDAANDVGVGTSSEAGSGDATVADRSTPTLDSATDAPVDAPTDHDADGADPLGAPCTSPLIAIDITVLASPTLSYSGVDVHAPVSVMGAVVAGTSHRVCAAAGDLLDLRAIPDNGAATHQWTGAPCVPGPRCKFTVTSTVVATVQLQ